MSVSFKSFSRLISTSRIVFIQANERLPNAEISEKSPNNKIALSSIFKGKRGILIGTPGAFTPGCSNQLSSYIRDSDRYSGEYNIDVIACIAVNDPYVMTAWGNHQKTDNKVKMLSDAKGEVAKAMKLNFDSQALGGLRMKRFAAFIDDNLVKFIQVEPDNTGLSTTLSEKFMANIEKN